MNRSFASPPRAEQSEEEQMRIAIERSLQEISSPVRSPVRSQIPSVRSPVRSQIPSATPALRSPTRTVIRSPVRSQIPSATPPLRSPTSPIIISPGQSPNYFTNDTEDLAIQEAIQASIAAAASARVAVGHFNNISTARSPPRATLSPNAQRRLLIEEQNREYEEALRIDIENAEQARLAAEAAARAASEAEAAARALQEARMHEERRKLSLQPPILRHPIQEDTPVKDIVTMNFRLPSGVVNHSFHHLEPLSSVIQQLRFDTKHVGDFKLSTGVGRFGRTIDCAPETSLHDCNLIGRIMINVTLL